MEIIELSIERMSFGPAAVARYQQNDGDRPVVIFVRGGAPGDRVRAKVTKRHKNYWEADLVEILEPSPHRVAPPCPVVDRCGGCQWQHLSYEAQLDAKKDILLHQLTRSTSLSRTRLDSLLQIHGAPSPFGYRGRIQARGNAKGLGFFEEGSHDIVHTDRCLVAHPLIQETWAKFVATKPLAELAKPKGQFKVEWSINESGQIQEVINKPHAALGFTQVNAEQNQTLVKIVAEAARQAEPQGLLLDLYGGSGNLSSSLSDHFSQIIGVETHGPGVAPSEIVPPLPLGNTFVNESTESFLKNQRWKNWTKTGVSCAIADPPRSGLGEAAKPLAELDSPLLILVSCDPSTLARDLPAFLKRYEIQALHLVDLFPQTFHIETVVVLRNLVVKSRSPH